MKRRILLVFALVFAAFSVSQPAWAQQVCLQLESQLAALERQNSVAVYQQLLSQYQQAQSTYDRLYYEADRAGCIPRLLRPNVPAACDPVRAQLEQQYNRMLQLQEQARAADPSRVASTRLELLRALANNNCGPQYEAYRSNPVQLGNGALIDRILGRDQPLIIPLEEYQPVITTYRTLCVRACDGYYFPISFATTPTQFEADQRTCQAQCPGAMLYTHRNPGAPVEDAVSINGQPYTALENAFAYRTAYNPECGCQPATSIAEVPETPVSEETAIVVAAATPSIPLPLVRPEPSEDPDTIANRIGGFVPGVFHLGLAAGGATVMVDDDGTRLIGPAYYYAR